jgi:hypothetical protein
MTDRTAVFQFLIQPSHILTLHEGHLNQTLTGRIPEQILTYTRKGKRDVGHLRKRQTELQG